MVHKTGRVYSPNMQWDGLIAGTDGSVDERTERMGAGYVLGDDPAPILTFFA